MSENTTEEIDAEVVPLIVSEEIRSYLYDSARWTNFLSIVGFITAGLIILSALTVSSVLNTMSAGGMSPAIAKIGGTGLAFVLFIYAMIVFYPSLLLYKYSTYAKKAVLYGSQEELESAMKKMKDYFKYCGILTIVLIAFYILAIFTTRFATGG